MTRRFPLFSLALTQFRVQAKENLLETLPNPLEAADSSAADAALWRYGLISELLHGCSMLLEV